MTDRTLQEAMSERNISRYRLSKISGIPWATLSDICSGKTELERCSAGTVLKLSKALGLTMEETLDLETSMVSEAHDVPEDLSYLEVDLPESLRAAIEEVRLGFERDDPNIDLLLDTLYGEINANLWSDEITKNQADYLRSRYYYGDSDD